MQLGGVRSGMARSAAVASRTADEADAQRKRRREQKNSSDRKRRKAAAEEADAASEAEAEAEAEAEGEIFASPFLVALLPRWAGAARRLQGGAERPSRKLGSVRSIVKDGSSWEREGACKKHRGFRGSQRGRQRFGRQSERL